MPARKTPAKPKASAAVKAAPVKKAEEPAVVLEPGEAVVKSAGLKLKEFLARVEEQCQAPKKTQREVTEAVLAVLGAALAAGEELNLPGLGRTKLVKSQERAGQTVLTVKVKNAGQKKGPAGKDPLADDEEGS